MQSKIRYEILIFYLILFVLFVYVVWLMNCRIFETKHKKQIVILAGQSNMAGRGGVVKRVWDGYVPPECHRNPAVHRLNRNSIWEVAQEPLHEDIDLNKTCGIGPTMVFANVVLEMDPEFGTIGLVPCAVGGTSIDKWSQSSRYIYLILF